MGSQGKNLLLCLNPHPLPTMHGMQTVESMWRARWVRLQAQEEQRPDPLEHTKAGTAGRKLSDIAEWETSVVADSKATGAYA